MIGSLQMFLFKSVLAGVVTLGIVGDVVYHFKGDRETTESLNAANTKIAVLEAKITGLETENTQLNERIKSRNQKVLDDLAKAEADKAAAEADAQAAREAKKRSDNRLIEAQKKYLEALNYDQNLRAYSRTPVPPPVLDRLRSANGET